MILCARRCSLKGVFFYISVQERYSSYERRPSNRQGLSGGYNTLSEVRQRPEGRPLLSTGSASGESTPLLRSNNVSDVSRA